MLAQERQQQILALLDRLGTIRTIDLAEEFQVTDETIRRDLQTLAENHQLTRIHGGATGPTGRPKLQSFTERCSVQVEQKNAIAQAALELIEPGRTYAFDSSTTGFALVSKFPDLPFRVVTNAFAVIDQLVRLQNVELITIGGRYDRKTQTFVGSDSFESLRRHNINIAFLSCIGLDARRGASEGFEHQAVFKESLVRVSEKIVLLADSTKLQQRSEYFFASLEDITRIITDHAADPGIVAELRGRGCEVTVAPGP